MEEPVQAWHHRAVQEGARRGQGKEGRVVHAYGKQNDAV